MNVKVFLDHKINRFSNYFEIYVDSFFKHNNVDEFRFSLGRKLMFLGTSSLEERHCVFGKVVSARFHFLFRHTINLLPISNNFPGLYAADIVDGIRTDNEVNAWHLMLFNAFTCKSPFCLHS